MSLLEGSSPDGSSSDRKWTLKEAATSTSPGAADALRLSVHDAGGAPIVQGTLQSHVGRTAPRHWFHVGQAVHAAPALSLFKVQRTLLLGNDLTGWAELTALQWAAPPDVDAAGRAEALAWLARAAAQRVQADPARWGTGLFCELPGLRPGAPARAVVELDGPETLEHAPFWRALPQHFFRGDAAEAAARLGPVWRSHVAALLPRQLVYASFLPEAAQRALGAENPELQWVRAALESAGWRWRQQVRVDDGGPVLQP